MVIWVSGGLGGSSCLIPVTLAFLPAPGSNLPSALWPPQSLCSITQLGAPSLSLVSSMASAFLPHARFAGLKINQHKEMASWKDSSYRRLHLAAQEDSTRPSGWAHLGVALPLAF